MEIEIADDEDFVGHKVNGKRTTLPIMTKFEYSKLLACRTIQLANGSSPRVDTKGLNSEYKIAEKELFEQKIPLVIVRRLHNGKEEIWRMKDIQHIMNY